MLNGVGAQSDSYDDPCFKFEVITFSEAEKVKFTPALSMDKQSLRTFVTSLSSREEAQRCIYFVKQNAALTLQEQLLREHHARLIQQYDSSLNRDAGKLYSEFEQKFPAGTHKFKSREEGVAFFYNLLDQDAKLSREGKQRIDIMKRAVEETKQVSSEKPRMKKGLFKRIIG